MEEKERNLLDDLLLPQELEYGFAPPDTVEQSLEENVFYEDFQPEQLADEPLTVVSGNPISAALFFWLAALPPLACGLLLASFALLGELDVPSGIIGFILVAAGIWILVAGCRAYRRGKAKQAEVLKAMQDEEAENNKGAR